MIMLKLDYTLELPEQRNELVKDILENQLSEDEINDNVLEVLADYLIMCMEKQERKERKILTDNRLTTVNKRELSFEGLVSQFENGEDGVYNLITDNNKNTIFQPKISITPKDIEEIPLLRQIHDSIIFWENKMKTATGREAYIIKHTIIDLRKDQYIVKMAYRCPILFKKITRSKHNIPLDDEVYVDSQGTVQFSGISLLDPNIISAILCNYTKFKQQSHGNFESDLWFIMEDFDNISAQILPQYPVYKRIVEYKIDGLSNAEIQVRIQQEFGIKHSVEYISSLWRNKIPKIIANAAEDQFLNWYYLTVERGAYKRCSHCGQVKLANSKYFSKNKTSKDSFYSICKECRKRTSNK